MTPEQLAAVPALLDAIQKRIDDADIYEGADIDDAKTAIAAAQDLLGVVDTMGAKIVRQAAELAQAVSAIHVADGTTGRRTAERDQVRAELQATRNNRLISAIFGHHKGAPRPFALHRREDETGVSGTGVVAVGTEFPDGMVVLRWTSAFPTSVVFHERGIESVEAVHGHGGKTQIVWLSEELEPLAQMEQERDRLAAQRDEVLELCNDAQQVIGQRGFLAVDAIRAVFAAEDAPVESEPCPDHGKAVTQ